MSDHLPPHDLDAEQALLGALLQDRDAIAAVADWLAPDAFWSGANAIIYRAIRGLWRQRYPADLVTLNAFLAARNLADQTGGPGYLAALLTTPGVAPHAQYYAELIAGLAKRRAVIDAASKLVAAAYQGEVDPDDAAMQLRRAAEPFAPPSDERAGTFDGGMDDHRLRTLDRWAGRLNERIVPSGIAAIDRKTYGGFRGGDLVYVGGTPGSGKTSLALQVAINAARAGRRALLVELEMTREALFNRAIAAEAGVPFGVAYQRAGDVLQRDRWLDASERLEALPVTVATDLATTDRIRGAIERAVAERPIEIVFIDHLDLLADPDLASQNAEQRTAKTSKRLKRIAMELDIPIVPLVQLSRAVEAAPPFKPALNHFRYSGAIEQDAEYAFLLYRRRYYVDRDRLEADPHQDYVTGTNWHRVEVMVAKHRNGEVGAIELAWEPELMRFREAA